MCKDNCRNVIASISSPNVCSYYRENQNNQSVVTHFSKHYKRVNCCFNCITQWMSNWGCKLFRPVINYKKGQEIDIATLNERFLFYLKTGYC